MREIGSSIVNGELCLSGQAEFQDTGLASQLSKNIEIFDLRIFFQLKFRKEVAKEA